QLRRLFTGFVAPGADGGFGRRPGEVVDEHCRVPLVVAGVPNTEVQGDFFTRLDRCARLQPPRRATADTLVAVSAARVVVRADAIVARSIQQRVRATGLRRPTWYREEAVVDGDGVSPGVERDVLVRACVERPIVVGDESVI